MIKQTPNQDFCRKSGIGFDPQDIEVTMGWMERAKNEKDFGALENLFWKMRLQIDALEEEYFEEEDQSIPDHESDIDETTTAEQCEKVFEDGLKKSIAEIHKIWREGPN